MGGTHTVSSDVPVCLCVPELEHSTPPVAVLLTDGADRRGCAQLPGDFLHYVSVPLTYYTSTLLMVLFR